MTTHGSDQTRSTRLAGWSCSKRRRTWPAAPTSPWI